MEEGEYKNAAEYVLEHAEELAKQAETLPLEEKEALLEKSDCIASTYRELLFLASNQQLQELHRMQKEQIAETKLKIEEGKNLTSLIVEKVVSFIEMYESLTKLFIVTPTIDNIFNSALHRLKSFPNNEPPYTKDEFLQDLFKLLGYVEPASTKFSFLRDRRQILGTRYKCERGYSDAIRLIDEIKGLLSRLDEITIQNHISYQEIYWRCGIDITSSINGILNKVRD